MRGHMTQLFGDETKVSRGGFLRRAGVAGLAVAGIGDLVAAPLVSAKVTARGYSGLPSYSSMSAVPNSCEAVATCHLCNGCCGSPCKPTGSEYCYYCTATPCGAAGPVCLSGNTPNPRYICCN